VSARFDAPVVIVVDVVIILYTPATGPVVAAVATTAAR